MEQLSSSSKVTVEYFDPYGVYPLLSPSLTKRLPLRNLHWESHAGPLRSIDSLHIELVKSSEVNTTSELNQSSPANLNIQKSEESKSITGDDGSRINQSRQVLPRVESQSGPARVSTKERRHQIPGLRETPYLKLYFLRCDDIDTYRAQARPHLKQWIKEHTLSSQITSKSSAQENYDAYEWLIIHIITPPKAATNQSRTSKKHPEGNSGLSSEKTGPRWRMGSSTTIFEKLKADFNGSSKSSVDRVAQIRLDISNVTTDIYPQVMPAISKSCTETPHENEDAWQDLISKLKSLILAAFNTRVNQYEEDIREKDAQRSLPGWNFCTFFLLKEGLARGFENVGLVEDSLVEYDELAIGFDAIVREQAVDNRSEHGGSFLPFTDDLKRQAEIAVTEISNELEESSRSNTRTQIDMKTDLSCYEEIEIPLNATRKRYRELILANNISIFDFRCYLFSRQLYLLLRLANASNSNEALLSRLHEQFEQSPQSSTPRNPISQVWDEDENLVVLSKICKRTKEFILGIPRIMHTDISTAYQHQNRRSFENETNHTDMNNLLTNVSDNIIRSFVFSIALQILAQTHTKSLSALCSKIMPSPRPDKQESSLATSEPKFLKHLMRSSSLATRSEQEKYMDQNSLLRSRRASVPDHSSKNSSLSKTGLEELAANRAELFHFSRSILQRAGEERGWSVGWKEMAIYQSNFTEELEDIGLGQDYTEVPPFNLESKSILPFSHGISSNLLRISLESEHKFYSLYETLSLKILRHYTIANHQNSIQSSLADFAVLKYHLKDYVSASSYLNRIITFFGETGWSNIELPMLIIHGKCLQHLQRKDEYARVVIKLLTKTAKIENERLKHKSATYRKKNKVTKSGTLLTEPYLSELFKITRTLEKVTNIPLQSFFGQVEVDENVYYDQNMDSFLLQIRLLYLLDDELEIEKARVRICPDTNDSNHHIWLENMDPLILYKGINQISVQSKTTISGTYLLKSITLTGNNVTYSYEQATDDSIQLKKDSFLRCPRILIYQRPETFDIKLHSSRFIHLGRNRSLELELSSGWNNVFNGEIRIRAATAGLRLQTSESKVVFGSTSIFKNQDVGIIRFGAMKSYSCAIFAVPFSLETEISDVSIKIELSFTTENGKFSCATMSSEVISFPLGVNVQDFFKHECLFSKFTISSASSDPLRLLDSRLDGSEVFETFGGLLTKSPLVIYPRQPATITYRITKKKNNSNSYEYRKKHGALSLVLTFLCVEEEILATIRTSLVKMLKDSSLYTYTRLITTNVVREVRQNLSPRDLECAALLGEIPISHLSTVKWRDFFVGLGQNKGEVSNLIVEFLQGWLENLSTISLNTYSDEEESFPKSCSITIPVDVPSKMVVNTTDLQLVMPHSLGPQAVVNRPIAASLKVKWTRIWDFETRSEKKNSGEEYFEFFYEINAPSETWVVGGRQKGHFKVPKISDTRNCVQSLVFPVILIPLYHGLLPFPTVEIKTAPHSSAILSCIQSSTTMSLEQNVSFETDNKNTAEFVHVVSDSSGIVTL